MLATYQYKYYFYFGKEAPGNFFFYRSFPFLSFAQPKLVCFPEERRLFVEYTRRRAAADEGDDKI